MQSAAKAPFLARFHVVKCGTAAVEEMNSKGEEGIVLDLKMVTFYHYDYNKMRSTTLIHLHNICFTMTGIMHKNILHVKIYYA